MSYEQLVTAVETLTTVNAALKTAVQETQVASEASRDAAEAFAVDALNAVTLSQGIVLQAPIDAAAAAQVVLTGKVSKAELAAPGGAGLVGHGQAKSAIANQVSAFIDGGALHAVLHGGAVGDGGIHPLSEVYSTLQAAQMVYPFVTSLTQSRDWAGINHCLLQNRPVYVPGKYTLNEGLYLTRTSSMFGDGVDRWDSVRFDGADQLATFQKEDGRGSQLAFYGSGAKVWRQYGISDCSTSGGKRVVNGKTISLLNFMNTDAVGGAVATPRMYSAAVRAEAGASIEGLRLVPYLNGIQGYKDYAFTGLAADWDVGLDVTGCWNGRFRNLQVVGYWRMAGLLFSIARTTQKDGTAIHGNGERNLFENCVFQGLRGISIRGYDRGKVVSSTANSITLPYDPSFHWTDGTLLSFFGAQGTVSFNYTGTTFDSGANTVTMTGVTPAITGAVYEVRPRIGSNGIAFACFLNCYSMGLEHGSRQLAEDMGLGPSGPIEVSGMGVRQPTLLQCKFQTHETIAGLFHDCLNVRMIASQFEGKTGQSELVASPFDSGSQITTTYQRGSTDDLYAPGTLVSPSVSITGFNPRGCYFDRGMFQTEGVSDNDNPLISKNWRIGPQYLAGDSGTRFIKIPASDAVLQDIGITCETYELTTTSTDLNLKILGSKNFAVRNATGVTTLKVLQSGRTEVLGTLATVNDGTVSIGETAKRFSDTYSRQYTIGATGTVRQLSGTGSPEGVVAAAVGSTYQRDDGGVSTTFYVKQSGTGNTGWVAK